MTTTQSTRHNLPLAAAELAQRICGAVVTFAVLIVGMFVNNTAMTPYYQALLIIATLLALILVRGPKASLDHTPSTFPAALVATAFSWVVVIGVLLLLGYATKTSSIFSRRLLLTWAVATPVLIATVRFLLTRKIASMSRKSATRRRAIIAGVNPLGESLASKLQNDPRFGLTLDGFFDDRGLERLGSRLEGQLLGKLVDLPDYVRRHRIDRIYIALPIRNIQRVSQLLDDLHDTTASIYYVPDVFVFDLIQCRTDEIDGMPVVALCETPFFGTRGLAKRLSDIFLASIILLAISPLLLMIAAIVKLTTPGSVIFKQRRYGLDGEEIVVYKFRTMYVSEDGGTIRQASRDDNRITPIGAFLRRY
ncbi:MAG: sugar transferase, partial [Pseudomonadota bacterium]